MLAPRVPRPFAGLRGPAQLDNRADDRHWRGQSRTAKAEKALPKPSLGETRLRDRATDREFPKGIELLVTVDDDCDLTPLAKLGRQLAGHMMSHQAGASVFLASQRAECLRRSCPWKNCGPGNRVSCNALHCRRRPYLHDDLDAIRLKQELIAQPPPDVHAQLIEQLARDQSR